MKNVSSNNKDKDNIKTAQKNAINLGEKRYEKKNSIESYKNKHQLTTESKKITNTLSRNINIT